jgi:hypothetical protein
MGKRSSKSSNTFAPDPPDTLDEASRRTRRIVMLAFDDGQMLGIPELQIEVDQVCGADHLQVAPAEYRDRFRGNAKVLGDHQEQTA